MQWPARYGQSSDDNRPFSMFPLHAHKQLPAIEFFADEVPMIGKVRENLKE